MPVPTWRLPVAAAALALVVLLLPLHPAWMSVAVVDAVLLAVAVGDWLLAVRPAAVLVTRELPGIVPLDGRAEVSWRVANPSGRRLNLRLADELAPSLRAASRRARLVVPPDGRATTRTELQPSRRGHFRPSEIVLRFEGPLRLVARQGHQDLPGSIRVYPPFRSRDEAELRINK